MGSILALTAAAYRNRRGNCRTMPVLSMSAMCSAWRWIFS